MIAATVLDCAKGATCYAGSGLPTWVPWVTTIAGVFGVAVALGQLYRILRAVGVSEESNVINAVSHCAQRYHDIMRDIDDDHYGVKRGAFEPGSWWYRYSDLQTEQFAFFRKGLLDREIYELWMGELATAYHSAPRTGVETLAEGHRRYLDRTLLKYQGLHDFFAELRSIAHEGDVEARGAAVYALVDAYSPPPRWVRKRVAWILRTRKRRRWESASVEGNPPPVTYQMVASREEIARRVADVAEQINAAYAGRELVVVGILTGSFIFVGDLIRRITVPVEVEFITAASYGASMTPGPVEVQEVTDKNLHGRHVLVVDDILDTGNTLKAVLTTVARQLPASVASCVLIAKRKEQETDTQPEFVAFGEVQDVFVAGYGIDAAYRYRNLPDLYVVTDGELISDDA